MTNTPESSHSVADPTTASPATKIESAPSEQTTDDASDSASEPTSPSASTSTTVDASGSDSSGDKTALNPTTGTSETNADAQAPPENETSSRRTSVSDLGDVPTHGSESGSSGGGGGLLSRRGLSMAALGSYGVLTVFCLTVAVITLQVIQDHGMVHTPVHLWVVFYLSVLTPIVVAIGGARSASIVSAADDMAPAKRQSQTKEQ